MDILIVESSAKARTLQKYLGEGWRVLATGGHVETLPDDRRRHGKDASKAYWANRTGELPAPPWVWTERGEGAMEEIVEAAGDDPTFWIATDPDREGEFIAWSLEKHLSKHGPTHRVTFQEVTEEAVRRALGDPRPLDDRMVGSALVRKFLDRLVGFRTSKMAAAVIPGSSASMGRVQTPTLGFVVDRELERDRHVPIPYFEARARAEGVELRVRFHEPDDPQGWRNEAGQVDPTRTFDGDTARRAVAALEAAGEVVLTEARPRTRSSSPRPPLTTDAILQDAGSRFGWSPKKTSALASMLYEAGHITYIRTDSTRLAESAVQAARAVVKEAFGEEFLGGGAAAPAAATGPTQDAHEAIRPTRMEVAEVEVDDADARKLYRLVRARTLASQMAPSRSASLGIEATCQGFGRPLTGSVSWDTFAGWRGAMVEFDGERPSAPPAVPTDPGARWILDPATDDAPNPLLVEDETKPPPRYRPHTLVKAMKDAGIGRPSTYARTVEKLEEKKYVTLEEGALAPTHRGRAVWLEAAPLYTSETADRDDPLELFSTRFTAMMEERLDRIAAGELPAPAAWEEWRDQVRDLHEAAREQRNQGAITFRQRETLGRLLANAPAELAPEGAAAAEMNWQEAQDLIGQLREAGVKPAPSAAQLQLVATLAETLGMDPADAASLVDAPSLDALETSDRASALIDELQRLRDEQLPPSPRQRRYIESLLEQAGLPPEKAAALVGVASLDELTGGREGTASALIDQLLEQVGEGAEGGSGRGRQKVKA